MASSKVFGWVQASSSIRDLRSHSRVALRGMLDRTSTLEPPDLSRVIPFFSNLVAPVKYHGTLNFRDLSRAFLRYLRDAMKIKSCEIIDIDEILALYDHARQLQRQKQMVVWPSFDRSFIANEIDEQRQWKIVIDNIIACNWAITFSDKDIWEERDLNDAIYIHRIATHPLFRGNRFVDRLVDWAKEYAREHERQYVRLDTIGENRKLIDHYQAAGFEFLGIFNLRNTDHLPAHYKLGGCCLFELKCY